MKWYDEKYESNELNEIWKKWNYDFSRLRR